MCFALTVLSSCSDTLNAPTQSSLDESFIFSTPILAEEAVMGVHQSLCETNSYRGRFLPYYGLNTDIEWYNSSENTTTDDAKLTGYNPDPSGSIMNLSNGPWSMMYQAIERANLCIRGLRAYGDTQNKSDMAQLLGEALTLRAVVYADLIKAYGDVPARFEPISTLTLYLPKSDRDVIYKQIIADLAEAETLVAWPNATTATKSVERVNKAFIKGLRARICLAAAGYAQRPDGSIRLSNDPELTKEKLYPIVKQECLDVINSGTCSLGTFEQNFRRLCQENTSAGSESLYELPFSTGRGRVLYTFGVKHTTTDKYTGQAQGGKNGPLPFVYYDYDKDDVRRNITCVPYVWTNGIQVPNKLSSWCFGKLRYEWMTRIVTSTNDDGINWQFMRLADVYLMAAEAINELDGPAAAAPYLKTIRSRAFVNNAAKVDAYMASVTNSKENFFTAIVDERGLEFCGEMLRKADLIRWNLLSTKINEAKTKMTALANRTGVYADLPEKIYYTTASDGETIKIYGLEHGNTDAEGAALAGYSNKGWFISNGLNNLTDLKISSLAQNQSATQNEPNSRQFWPIPTVAIAASNNILLNDSWYQPTTTN
jgi:SusD family.